MSEAGYKKLISYQQSVIIYDFSVEFCAKYISYHSRTKDQMEQAARSGKQNIVEASLQRTSKKGELKLLGVARASLQELLEDYGDFLRQKGLVVWDKDSSKAKQIRGLAYKTDTTYRTYKSYIGNTEAACNVMICLINQTNFLLDRQIKVLEDKFIKEGGYGENLFKKRLSYKTKYYLL